MELFNIKDNVEKFKLLISIVVCTLCAFPLKIGKFVPVLNTKTDK